MRLMALTGLYAKMFPLFATIFLALSLAARVMGGTQPPHPALQGFAPGCAERSEPCWHGIVLGVTTANELEAILAFAGEPQLSRSIFSQDFTLVFTLPQTGPYCRAAFEIVDGVAVRGELSLCRGPDIRIGDFALLLEQEPNAISLPPNEIVYGQVGINAEGWPAPYSRINHINLLPANARFQHFPWRGFVSRSRYCELVPSYPRCR